jgi:hypothetical protein
MRLGIAQGLHAGCRAEKGSSARRIIAIQTFGDWLGFNSHCHILITDGCFYGKGMFRVAPPPGVEESGRHLPAQDL